MNTEIPYKAHWIAKLTVEDVLAIRAALLEGVTQKELGQRYHVTQPAISAIVNGRSWRRVGHYTPPIRRETDKQTPNDKRIRQFKRVLEKHGL